MERKVYIAPDMEVTKVVLENPICSGSADIQNPNNEQTGQIQAQDVNNAFELENSASSLGNNGNGWDFTAN